MKRIILALALACAFILVASASADVAYNCAAPCTIKVSISDKFPVSERQIIREVIADFNLSPEINLVEANGGMIKFVVDPDGGFTTSWRIAGGSLKGAVIHITPAFFGWCCDEHDGMRGVYCHELMHGLGINDFWTRAEPSCFNGTSPYLGAEDRLWISQSYPVG